MQGEKQEKQAITAAWNIAWSDKRFRVMTVIGSVLLLTILISFPFFFTHIEKRAGILMHDRILTWIKPYDVSVPTFIVIWSMTVLLWIRCVQDPAIFIVFLFAFVVLSVTRIITISFIPLDPPEGLIPLRDPLSSIFYGGTHVFISKDLFFSGHTSIQLLMFFTFKRRWDKILALISSILIGTFVLVQHVHYSIDVIAAVLFSFVIYRLSRKITRY